ncbi:MAG: hypothetical protein J1G04_03750 [Clostridiales bacterium]|nr:hypothetical protein [Clostridiales bacterium]
MGNKFLFKFLLTGALVVAAVLWILQVSGVIEWFSGWIAIAIVSGAAGVALILRGIFEKTNALGLKKINIILGAGFLVIALLMVVNIFAIKNELVVPIIALIGAVALLLGVFVTGGKSSDTGDNQKAGYKNYYERKAEEEKKKKDND